MSCFCIKSLNDKYASKINKARTDLDRDGLAFAYLDRKITTRLDVVDNTARINAKANVILGKLNPAGQSAMCAALKRFPVALTLENKRYEAEENAVNFFNSNVYDPANPLSINNCSNPINPAMLTLRGY